MVTKTTFKKKFPDVKVQKLQTEVVFSRKHVEDTVLQMCGMMGLGLLYYSYSNKWITVYTSDKMKKALDSMKPGTEVFHEHYGVYGKVISEELKKEISRQRTAFINAMDKLDEAADKLKEENTFETTLYKLRFMEASSYGNNSDIFTISNRFLLEEFAKFMKKKIQLKIEELELLLISE